MNVTPPGNPNAAPLDVLHKSRLTSNSRYKMYVMYWLKKQ